MKVNQQKSSNKMWKDETGLNIPTSRLTKAEKLKEKYSATLYNKAKNVSAKLSEFKTQIAEMCQEVFDAHMDEANVKTTGKGNFIWYNFDHSIKIEVSVSERIGFDDLEIAACKSKLDEFLDLNVQTKDDFIKALVLDAFETSKGKLDAKKVMSLLRHKSKITSPLFQEAMVLLEKSIRRPESKTYFRIWGKDAEGKYQNIDLNFSSL